VRGRTALLFFAFMAELVAPDATGDSFVWIGNAGNADDAAGYGGVSYEYRIGRTEISIADWKLFYDGRLTNGVAGELSSSYDYWNKGTTPNQQVGTGAPATFMTWHQAAQYCNWLTTGRATNGAYTMSSAGEVTAVNRLFRNTEGTVYVLPVEDEWYKAAYYTGSGYSLYANGTDIVPRQNTDSNYGYNDGVFPWAAGSGTAEQNGTFDMMGNVAEWLEGGADRTRGGGFNNSASYISKNGRLASSADRQVGFRIVLLNESALPPVLVRNRWDGHSFYRPFNWPAAVSAAVTNSSLDACLKSIKILADSYLAASTNIVVRGTDPELDGTVINNFRWYTPVIALTALYTGDARYIDYVNGQLAETATWDPLEREGLEGGAWLYTSWAIASLVEVMDIMGDLLEENVRTAVVALLQKEADGIVDDYIQKRQWFFKPRGVYVPDRYASNQYVILASGLGMASLYLGGSRNFDGYELAVELLSRSAGGMGNDGSCVEGFGYAQMANSSFFKTLLAARDAGDSRFNSRPNLEAYINWMTHLFMPGLQTANFSDSGYKINSGYPPGNDLLLASLLLNDHNRLNWIRTGFYGGYPGKSPVALRCLYENEVGGFGSVPPDSHFNYFSDAHLVTWRSGWDSETATALWIKGGSQWELHNHRDNGQISVYCGGTRVLMDAGLDGYDHPLYTNYFETCAGHNILQAGGVGGAVDTPLVVSNLTSRSGSLQMEGAAAYSNVTSWIRSVSWTNNAEFRMEIVDSARLTAEKSAGDEWFRFHTGAVSSNDLTVVSLTNGQWEVFFAGAGAVFAFTSEQSILVDVEEQADGSSSQKKHACIRIKGAQSTSHLTLRTSLVLTNPVTPVDPPEESGSAVAEKVACRIHSRPVFSTGPATIGWDPEQGYSYSVYWTTNLLSGFRLLEGGISWSQTSFTDEASDEAKSVFYKVNREKIGK
jgi:sulfatase modifying factor 1